MNNITQTQLQFVGIFVIADKVFNQKLQGFVAQFAQLADFKPHHQPHITLLYAPLANHKTLVDVEMALAQADDLVLPAAYTVTDPYVSQYQTVNLAIAPKQALREVHLNLITRLRHLLHPIFLEALNANRPIADWFAVLNTSNIGDQYQPHITCGGFEQLATGQQIQQEMVTFLSNMVFNGLAYISNANDKFLAMDKALNHDKRYI